MLNKLNEQKYIIKKLHEDTYVIFMKTDENYIFFKTYSSMSHLPENEEEMVEQISKSIKIFLKKDGIEDFYGFGNLEEVTFDDMIKKLKENKLMKDIIE